MEKLDKYIDAKVVLMNSTAHFKEVQFNELRAVDRFNDANEVLSFVAKFEKLVGTYGAQNQKLLSDAKKTGSKKAMVAADLKVSANNKIQLAQATLLQKQIKKVMDKDTVILAKSKQMKSQNRKFTIHLQQQVNTCKKNIIDLKALKKGYQTARRNIINKIKRRIRRNRNLRILQKLVKKSPTTKPTLFAALRAIAVKELNADDQSYKCAIKVQANTKIISSRLQVYRDHINDESKCKSWRNKTVRVINGEMGHYQKIIVKLNKTLNALNERTNQLKKAKNLDWKNLSKQVNNVLGYVRDTAYKSWSLDYQVNMVKGWQCSAE